MVFPQVEIQVLLILFYVDTHIVLEQGFHVIYQLVDAFPDIPSGDMMGFYPHEFRIFPV